MKQSGRLLKRGCEFVLVKAFESRCRSGSCGLFLEAKLCPRHSRRKLPSSHRTTMSVSSSKSTVTTTPATGHNDPEHKPAYDSIPKDFGIFPVPRRLRYDPQKPFYFGTMLNLSFGFASTFSKILARVFINTCGVDDAIRL